MKVFLLECPKIFKGKQGIKASDFLDEYDIAQFFMEQNKENIKHYLKCNDHDTIKIIVEGKEFYIKSEYILSLYVDDEE